MINIVLSILLSGNTVIATAPLPKGMIWQCVRLNLAAEKWTPAHCGFVDIKGEILLDEWPNMVKGEYTAQLEVWRESDGKEFRSNVVTFVVK